MTRNLFFIMSLWCVGGAQGAPTTAKPPKNLILFIGDGMGISHVTATRLWRHGAYGKNFMENFPITGFSRTASSSDYVTDSAAAATALASGVRTYNGAIGVSDPSADPQHELRELQSIMDLAKAAGKSTGVITTVTVTDATPAAFYAHRRNRRPEIDTAAEVHLSTLDLILGGGRSVFNKK
jgi:alkaline phosphatase